MKILVLGGFGYDNTGDEALLAYALRTIGRTCPEASVVVAAPVPERTARTHGLKASQVTYAPRECFFGASTSHHYAACDREFTTNWYAAALEHVVGLRALARAVRRWRGVSSLAQPELEQEFLTQLQSCDLVYYCGGGYNTGRTRSRLWDSALVALLARRYGKPVFMSSQQVGVWRTFMDRFMGWLAMSRAKAIIVRDQCASAPALAGLGVPQARRIEYCDEAVFTAVDTARLPAGLRPHEYLAVSFRHGFLDTESENERFCAFFARLVDSLARRWNSRKEVVLVPTGSFDVPSQRAIAQRLSSPIRIIDYDFAYPTAAAIFGSAYATVSFPHHPLIFSVAGARPAATVFAGDYYRHKNLGSMRVYGLEKYCVEARSFDEAEFRRAEQVIEAATRDSETISAALTKRVRELAQANLTEIHLRRLADEITCQSASSDRESAIAERKRRAA